MRCAGPVRRSLRDYWDGGGNGVAGFDDEDEDEKRSATTRTTCPTKPEVCIIDS
jgi:hypothetical protein